MGQGLGVQYWARWPAGNGASLGPASVVHHTSIRLVRLALTPHPIHRTITKRVSPSSPFNPPSPFHWPPSLLDAFRRHSPSASCRVLKPLRRAARRHNICFALWSQPDTPDRADSSNHSATCHPPQASTLRWVESAARAVASGARTTTSPCSLRTSAKQ